MSASHDVADLLLTARDVFRSELAEQLPAESRYAAAMVASALAIAARGLDAAEADNDGFLRLYGEDVRGEPPEALERRLVADIRAGRFDVQQAGRLRALLLERTVRRLKVSDPEALAASGLD